MAKLFAREKNTNPLFARYKPELDAVPPVCIRHAIGCGVPLPLPVYVVDDAVLHGRFQTPLPNESAVGFVPTKVAFVIVVLDIINFCSKIHLL
jgi:hypothetical protein